MLFIFCLFFFVCFDPRVHSFIFLCHVVHLFFLFSFFFLFFLFFFFLRRQDTGKNRRKVPIVKNDDFPKWKFNFWASADMVFGMARFRVGVRPRKK